MAQVLAARHGRALPPRRLARREDCQRGAPRAAQQSTVRDGTQISSECVVRGQRAGRPSFFKCVANIEQSHRVSSAGAV
eukprot:40825-Pleurochrysis_carterae.AAC.1